MRVKFLILKEIGLKEEMIKYIHSYQKVGDIVLVKISKELENYKYKIGEFLLEKIPKTKTVCRILGIEGKKRVPRIEILAGNGTETIHKENKCIFKLDISKVMFSKGNLFERRRLIEYVKNGEKIIDLCCGIGYFSIPIAKFRDVTIVCIDINKDAIKYLLENIKLNKLKNVFPVIGDSLKIIKEKNVFDRVIIGCFFDSFKFLNIAKKIGKEVTFHTLMKKEDVENFLKTYNVIRYRKVKSYAPHIYHYVFDIKF
ncbi:MAG: methyltransferase domain-containing protein [Candidatus Aenigmarchaeota archaeon]|nr:methyltransferase domain-containing protein [Candidatus Aenigmarchaeota archaeon]MDW8149479.1 methyltransferase domain-containing protein [Candidatus Aenigmarchaeota archaeon]